MSALDSATYIVGYLASIAAILYFLAEIFIKNPMVKTRIAYWFFMFVVMFKLFFSLVDLVLK